MPRRLAEKAKWPFFLHWVTLIAVVATVSVVLLRLKAWRTLAVLLAPLAALYTVAIGGQFILESEDIKVALSKRKPTFPHHAR